MVPSDVKPVASLACHPGQGSRSCPTPLSFADGSLGWAGGLPVCLGVIALHRLRCLSSQRCRISRGEPGQSRTPRGSETAWTPPNLVQRVSKGTRRGDVLAALLLSGIAVLRRLEVRHCVGFSAGANQASFPSLHLRDGTGFGQRMAWSLTRRSYDHRRASVPSRPPCGPPGGLNACHAATSCPVDRSVCSHATDVLRPVSRRMQAPLAEEQRRRGWDTRRRRNAIGKPKVLHYTLSLLNVSRHNSNGERMILDDGCGSMASDLLNTVTAPVGR
ncbi:hypothetical protein C8Q74DRAFT_150664 [Fomes fomentarius]|nr:hypothetical protein C8Q74DRAFT_150664 [Fomes fomentarius]